MPRSTSFQMFQNPCGLSKAAIIEATCFRLASGRASVSVSITDGLFVAGRLLGVNQEKA
jgi:hypothetical protein